MIWTQDLQGAYRRFPVRRPSECFCAINTPSDVLLFQHHAIMFGATAAVWNFNRAADALTFVTRRLLATTVCHCIDDFVGVEGQSTALSGFKEFTGMAAILGVKMKDAEAQEPSFQHKVLGVTFTVGEEEITFSPHLERLQKTAPALRAALELLPHEAQRLAGKLVFLTSTMFGQLGRAALRPFYGRARGLSAEKEISKLNVPLRQAIQFLLVLFDEIKPRTLPSKVNLAPSVLYTDAFFVMKGVQYKPGDDAIRTLWPKKMAPHFVNGLGFVFHSRNRPRLGDPSGCLESILRTSCFHILSRDSGSIGIYVAHRAGHSLLGLLY